MTGKDRARIRLWVALPLAVVNPVVACLSYEDTTLAQMLAGAVDVIIAFHNQGPVYSIRSVWLAADDTRRGDTAADLLAHGA